MEVEEVSAPHIHAPQGEYVGQVRGQGCRIWRTVITTKNSAKHALAGAVRKMKPGDKRARVLFCAEWYDPVVVMEASRK